MKLNSLQIKAVGYLLVEYSSDIEYIQKFKDCMKESNSLKDIGKNDWWFKKFLTEYKIIRNIKKDSSKILLETTFKWLKENKNSQTNVDDFCLYLTKHKKITEGKKLLSLSSKILFLHNPITIFPYDKYAAATLKSKQEYKDFGNKLSVFKTEKEKITHYILKLTDKFLETFEEGSSIPKNELIVIRKNRIVDKVLWVEGKSHNKTS